MTAVPNADLFKALDTIRAALTAHDERTTLLDLLRDHVMDWGHCDHPADCDCSDARARRFLAAWQDNPTWLEASQLTPDTDCRPQRYRQP